MRKRDRGKTVTKPRLLKRLGLALSEKQISQVVENLESGDNRKEAVERTAMRPRQVRYQAGKLEIQEPDSHLSTAPAACGAKKKTAVYTKCLTRPCFPSTAHLSRRPNDRSR